MGALMKKTLAAIALLLIAVVSFVAGTTYDRRSAAKQSGNAVRHVLYYVDPMHPAYKSDKPGIAPDCGMQLKPVYSDEVQVGEAELPSSLAPGAVQVSREKQQLMGIQVEQLERTPGLRSLRTLGRVTFEETSLFRVAPPVEGLIRNAGAVTTGSFVAKDQVLATFYNRDFLTGQQTYLYALNTMDRLKQQNEDGAEQLKATEAQMRAAEENLEFLGMSETQIHELARTRQIARNVELRSPVAGLVVARNVSPGLRFDRSAELFRIVKLNKVWVLADISEDEAEIVRPGSIARVSLPNQRKTFTGQVSDTLAEFDPATRRLKVRLELDNPQYQLRPDMFVDVELPVQVPAGLSVPEGAVLDSGTRKRVFVEHGEGFFEPREVETGRAFDDRVQIVKGLAPGDRILISGTFWVDSESRLQSAPSAISVPAEPQASRKIATRASELALGK